MPNKIKQLATYDYAGNLASMRTLVDTPGEEPADVEWMQDLIAR